MRSRGRGRAAIAALMIGGVAVTLALLDRSKRGGVAAADVDHVDPDVDQRAANDRASQRMGGGADLTNGAIPRFVTLRERGAPGRWSATLGFHDEPRDERWAVAMEQIIRQRLSPTELASVGITGLQVNDVECRATACRVSYEYPSRLSRLVTAAGFAPEVTPLILLDERSGPRAAYAGNSETRTYVREREQVTVQTSYWGFEGDAHRPETHREWSQRQLAPTRRKLQRMRDLWRQQQERRALKAAASP